MLQTIELQILNRGSWVKLPRLFLLQLVHSHYDDMLNTQTNIQLLHMYVQFF